MELVVLVATAVSLTLSIIVCVLIALLVLEVAAASCPTRQSALPEPVLDKSVRTAVIVPAHNEADGIEGTLTDVMSQLRQHDRLIVVADNCTDDTGHIARVLGAEVVQRFDPVHIGKG